MDEFQSLLVQNLRYKEIQQKCIDFNITTVEKLIILLDSFYSNSLSHQEKQLIALYKHIQVSYSEQQATQIFANVKKILGVSNIEQFQKITASQAQQCGFQLKTQNLSFIASIKGGAPPIIINPQVVPPSNPIPSIGGFPPFKPSTAVPFPPKFPTTFPSSQILTMAGQKFCFNTGKTQLDLHNSETSTLISNISNLSNEEDERKKIRDQLESLAKKCPLVKEKKDKELSLKIYKYPRYKQSQFKDISEFKTLIVIGETGVGKSTMINFFCNYYIGVQYEDPFRFIIVDETEGQVAVSQTSEVLDYYLKGTDGKPGIRIIDTPGFGDTRGQAFDEKITDLITSKLQELDSLTLICFVIKSSLNRLTIPQKYVMNRLLQLFGNNVVDNFLFLFTFADFEEPLALQALLFNGDKNHSKSPVADLISQTRDPFWLKFNNSAFQAVGRKENVKPLWDEAFDQFKQFYEEKILKTQFVSLKLTQEVILERKQLQNIIIHLRPQIQNQLNLISEIENQVKTIDQLTKDQFESKNFKFTQKGFDIVKVDLKAKEYVTNCVKCNSTCHYPCAIPESKEKQNCCAMRNGKCTICEGKCSWEDHQNMTFRFEVKEKVTEVILEDLKKRHQESSQIKLSKEDLKYQLSKELQKNKQQCQQRIQELLKSIKKLNEIALQPAISDAETDYIVYMIQEEEQQKKPGYQQRIQGLKAIKEQWQWLMEQINQK